MLGHSSFLQALVRYRPKLAVELDCRGSSPLHLASANGYIETVKYLLQVNSDMCLVRDEEDRTPLHLAIMKGWVDVAQELIQVKPEAVKYTLNTTGETLLHLAVKYNRVNCLKMLVESAGESRDVLNTRDNNGNTILHLAAYLKQTETVKYLLGAGVTMDAVNANGFTALDIVENMPRDLKAMEILMMLSKTAGSSSGRIPRSSGGLRKAFHDSGRNVNLPKREEDWADKKFSSLTIAATVVASMAYQAVLSPPGGLWSSDSGKDNQRQFEAGTSILATRNADFAEAFWICNTVSFISSSSILFLLVSGFHLKRKFLVWALMVSMWITITSMAISYSVAMWAIRPVDKEKTSTMVVNMALKSWTLLLFIVFAVHTVRFFVMVYRKLRKSWLSRQKSTSTGHVNV